MKTLSITAALLASVLFPSGASAVYIEFSAESGSRGSITITEQVTFKITTTETWQLNLVIKDAFQAAPSGFGWMGMDLLHDLTFSFNNANNTIGHIYNGTYGGSNIDVQSTDIKLLASSDAPPYNYQYSPGDIFTLNPGTYATSHDSSSYIVPTSGNYTMFLVNAGDTRASENGVTAVPEPSTWVFLGAGAVGLAATLRRRRLANAA